MYKGHPIARKDDFVIYVNFSRPYDSSTIGLPFYTCTHCKYILNDCNIISNVEPYSYE